jgi:hypothetical protein
MHLPMDESFDSVDLDDEFTRMGLDSLQNTEAIEILPNKRRKVDSGLNTLGEITSQIYNLLGSQDAMDLDGLDQVAQ